MTPCYHMMAKQGRRRPGASTLFPKTGVITRGAHSTVDPGKSNFLRLFVSSPGPHRRTSFSFEKVTVPSRKTDTDIPFRSGTTERISNTVAGSWTELVIGKSW